MLLCLDAIVDQFNGDDDKATILLNKYAVDSTGLTMQEKYSRVHFIESAHGLGIFLSLGLLYLFRTCVGVLKG